MRTWGLPSVPSPRVGLLRLGPFHRCVQDPRDMTDSSLKVPGPTVTSYQIFLPIPRHKNREVSRYGTPFPEFFPGLVPGDFVPRVPFPETHHYWKLSGYMVITEIINRGTRFQIDRVRKMYTIEQIRRIVEILHP